ncbi:hypothetical protein L227DRAFT_577282 [Lentinus tigrinus ALCF2SS1-6]|uniref:Uncharacterized protein n=1 Tax=Lentinus tigrinus ALCF2SS1-6 TaxID=1328759 RepID=A0A5C2S414_9APHY|nr:hypothetical protein L227DRAFT_577282 [Lentinus tigrinus ALCF2SS1-6]
MDDLIATHAATMQDPVIGPVDDVEIDGVTNATTKRQRTVPNGIHDTDSDCE